MVCRMFFDVLCTSLVPTMVVEHRGVLEINLQEKGHLGWAMFLEATGKPQLNEAFLFSDTSAYCLKLESKHRAWACPKLFPDELSLPRKMGTTLCPTVPA